MNTVSTHSLTRFRKSAALLLVSALIQGLRTCPHAIIWQKTNAFFLNTVKPRYMIKEFDLPPTISCLSRGKLRSIC